MQTLNTFASAIGVIHPTRIKIYNDESTQFIGKLKYVCKMSGTTQKERT